MARADVRRLRDPGEPALLAGIEKFVAARPG
jgi:hypothetical protein